jgi:hypothetical protein
MIGQVVPGVRIGDHQDPAGDEPGCLTHKPRGFPGLRVDQVRGGYLGHVPQRQQTQVPVAPGDSRCRPGLARAGTTGENQVLPRWPPDLHASVPACLLRLQDSDPGGELIADRRQAGKTGQAAHVLVGLAQLRGAIQRVNSNQPSPSAADLSPLS